MRCRSLYGQATKTILLQTFVQKAASLCHSLVLQSIAELFMAIIFFVSIFFLVLYISLLLYYRAAWVSIPEFRLPAHRQSYITRVSVIIPGRNEAHNLPTLLESLSLQTYPPGMFEVLIVDDHSTDDSNSIVNLHAPKNVRLISLEQFISPGEINSYKKEGY